MSNPSPGGSSGLAARQGDLFESLGPSIDAGFTTARRIELDATSWIEHVPGWLRASGALFDELVATAPWEQRHRYMFDRRVIEPRLTAEYQDISDAPQQRLHSVTEELLSLAVAAGDLVVMGGRSQRDWRPLGAQAGHPGRPSYQHQLRAAPALTPERPGPAARPGIRRGRRPAARRAAGGGS